MPSQIRRTLGVAMILAPLLGLASALVAPALKGDAAAQLAAIAQHQDRWYVYAVLITVSSWLLVLAVLGLTWTVFERSPRLASIGGGLTLLGAVIAIGDATVELMYWQMGAPNADRAQMAALADRYENAAGSSLLFTIGGLALISGLVLLAIALWRSHTAPTWAAAGIVLGAVINIAGFSANSNVLVIASNVVLLAALGRIGWHLASDPVTDRRHASQPHATTISRSSP
jgi:hypothetical protein